MIFALGHKKHVGKDTVGSYLLHNYPNFRRLMIASKLKRIVSILTSTEEWVFSDMSMKENLIEGIAKPCSHRSALKDIALACKQTLGEDIFVRCMRLENIANDGYHYVITDMRFIEEASYIRNLGGILVKISRDGLAVDSHISEQAMNDYNNWDHIIENNGTYEQLCSQVAGIMKIHGINKRKVENHD